jgi:hypothetical protein
MTSPSIEAEDPDEQDQAQRRQEGREAHDQA